MKESTSTTTVTDLEITGGPTCPICIHSLSNRCAYFPPKDETIETNQRPWTKPDEHCALGVFIFGEFPNAILMTYQEWMQWVIDERNADAREDDAKEDEPDDVVYTNGKSVYFVGPASKRGYAWGTWRMSELECSVHGANPKYALRAKSKFLPDRETRTEAARDLKKWAEKHYLMVTKG